MRVGAREIPLCSFAPGSPRRGPPQRTRRRRERTAAAAAPPPRATPLRPPKRRFGRPWGRAPRWRLRSAGERATRGPPRGTPRRGQSAAGAGAGRNPLLGPAGRAGGRAGRRLGAQACPPPRLRTRNRIHTTTLKPSANRSEVHPTKQKSGLRRDDDKSGRYGEAQRASIRVEGRGGDRGGRRTLNTSTAGRLRPSHLQNPHGVRRRDGPPAPAHHHGRGERRDEGADDVRG